MEIFLKAEIKMENIHKELSLEKNGEFLIKQKEIVASPIKDGQVRVKPINVGICSSDIPRCFDNKAYFYPLVIGHEFIVSVIEDPSKEFKFGDRCVVFPLRPCFKCEGCLSKEYNRCSKYSYYGSRTSGGMQTVLDVDKWNLLSLPENIDNITGSFIEPLAVCNHASKLVSKSKSILLYGGGFLSQILSQILSLNDCKITCIERNEYKDIYFSSDVSFYSNSKKIDDSFFDCTIECCGGHGVMEECIRITKPSGKIIQMANPSFNLNISADVLSKFMRKEQKLLGTWNSFYRPDNHNLCDWNQSIKLLETKKINIKNLISHKVELGESGDILKKIYARRENKDSLVNYNKAVVHII